MSVNTQGTWDISNVIELIDDHEFTTEVANRLREAVETLALRAQAAQKVQKGKLTVTVVGAPKARESGESRRTAIRAGEQG